MSPHFTAHILYILHAIEQLEEAVQKGEEYYSDTIVYNGILHLLQTLSESAAKLPDSIKNAHPNIEWRNFQIGRNALAHDYLGNLFFEDVLATIEVELPPLKKAMLQHAPNWKEIWSKHWNETLIRKS